MQLATRRRCAGDATGVWAPRRARGRWLVYQPLHVLVTTKIHSAKKTMQLKTYVKSKLEATSHPPGAIKSTLEALETNAIYTVDILKTTKHETLEQWGIKYGTAIALLGSESSESSSEDSEDDDDNEDDDSDDDEPVSQEKKKEKAPQLTPAAVKKSPTATKTPAKMKNQRFTQSEKKRILEFGDKNAPKPDWKKLRDEFTTQRESRAYGDMYRRMKAAKKKELSAKKKTVAPSSPKRESKRIRGYEPDNNSPRKSARIAKRSESSDTSRGANSVTPRGAKRNAAEVKSARAKQIASSSVTPRGAKRSASSSGSGSGAQRRKSARIAFQETDSQAAKSSSTEAKTPAKKTKTQKTQAKSGTHAKASKTGRKTKQKFRSADDFKHFVSGRVWVDFHKLRQIETNDLMSSLVSTHEYLDLYCKKNNLAYDGEYLVEYYNFAMKNTLVLVEPAGDIKKVETTEVTQEIKLHIWEGNQAEISRYTFPSGPAHWSNIEEMKEFPMRADDLPQETHLYVNAIVPRGRPTNMASLASHITQCLVTHADVTCPSIPFLRKHGCGTVINIVGKKADTFFHEVMAILMGVARSTMWCYNKEYWYERCLAHLAMVQGASFEDRHEYFQSSYGETFLQDFLHSEVNTQK